MGARFLNTHIQAHVHPIRKDLDFFLSLPLPIYLSVFLSLCLSECMSVCLSVSLSL